MASRDTKKRAQTVQEILALLRRVQVYGDRMASAFAALQGVHHTDLTALIHIMDAQALGSPMTPSRLQHELRISSGATTAVIDRLERHGHAVRERDTVDRRKVHLRHGDRARQVGADFFGPLGVLSDRVMGEFTDTQLETIRRFLALMAEAYAQHADTVDRRQPGTGVTQQSHRKDMPPS
ncbi:MAG TPA: MarR family transcriptional regulator, partial [Candidatus Lustribacter sp.]|nr:MarR family transcriptional regulator [Candidatus Lustribacter sp.]